MSSKRAGCSLCKKGDTYGKHPTHLTGRGRVQPAVQPQKQDAPQFKPPKKKRKWVKRLVIAVVVVAILAFVLKSCLGGAATAMGGSYLPVTASIQDLTVTVSGTGAIAPEHAYKVTTLVRGEILEAPFEEGDTVHKGDVLFRIDASDVEHAIEQARLAVQQAELSVRQAELNYQNLQNSAKDAKLTANASGIIAKLYVDEGDNVTAGTQVADIPDRSTMKLKAPFHSADAAALSGAERLRGGGRHRPDPHRHCDRHLPPGGGGRGRHPDPHGHGHGPESGHHHRRLHRHGHGGRPLLRGLRPL